MGKSKARSLIGDPEVEAKVLEQMSLIKQYATLVIERTRTTDGRIIRTSEKPWAWVLCQDHGHGVTSHDAF